MLKLLVVDLYHGDTVTSFKEAADAGLLGIIHKATTGATGVDKAYAVRRKSALDAGLLWGAYHWGTAAKVDDQIANFMKQAKPDEKTLVALDFEKSPPHTMSLDQAREFLTKIEEKLGRKAVLYSGSLIKEKLGNRKDAFFGSHRLWLAQYARNPVVQKSWNKFWLWQYTEGTNAGPPPKKCKGILGNNREELDCNTYDGTATQLRAEWAGSGQSEKAMQVEF
jgi:lysozyme